MYFFLSSSSSSDVVTDICSSLKLAASDAGVVTSDKHRRKSGRARQQPLQPWFNQSCEENRKIYQKSKRKYRKNKTTEHLISIQNASRAYKKKKSFRESDLSKTIRNFKSSNPKEYWNLLNGQTRSQNSSCHQYTTRQTQYYIKILQRKK